MKQPWPLPYFIGTIIISTAFVCYFLQQHDQQHADQSVITIVCTTGIIADAVKAIGGNYVCVKTLMGPGIDPHLYRARENDIHAFINASLVFYNGLHLEGKLADILHQMNHYTTTIAVADALDHAQLLVCDHTESIYDPHLWLDVNRWIIVVDYIKKSLIDHDPHHQAAYEHNAQIYCDQLHELNAYAYKALGAIPPEKRIVVTAHDAFRYFGDAYHVTVVGLQGLSTEAEAGIKDIENLTEFIIQHHVRTLFVESSIPQQTIVAVQQAAAARGHQVSIGLPLFSDALGDAGTPQESYYGMVKHNIDAIVAGLTVD